MAAATQGLPKRHHFAFPEQASNIQQIPSKSHSNTLCKTLIVLVLLLVIPLFPSKAPDFITQSVVTEFWEIIHLLFIGIAVSYGLFGRRTAQIVPEKNVDSRVDDPRAYLSGISQLYSIFDDGYENICGPDEQDMMQSSANCEFGEQFLGKNRCVIHSAKKIRSFELNDGGDNICERIEKNVNQTWCSQYLKGKSVVVVSNGKYFLGESSDSKPLNLPVRSLKSRVVDDDDDDDEDKFESNNRTEFSPKMQGKGNVDDDKFVKLRNVDDDKFVKIRGVVPMNLEEEFEEAGGRSSIPWRSRSGRMGNGEETSNTKPPAHYRPHSAGDFEFEHLKSRSLRSSKFSGSPELGSSRMENGERKRLFTAPKIAPLNVEASFGSEKTKPFSIGDLENIQKNFTDQKEEDLGKGKQAIESAEMDKKSSGIVKVLSRAKSVRTIKPNRYTMNQKQQNPPVDDQSKELDRIFPMPKPKPTLSEFHIEEKQDTDERDITEPGEGRQSELDKSSDEDDARTNFENDSELEGSEVDKKAGEFIAKFREQIRLQKTSSIDGYSGW